MIKVEEDSIGRVRISCWVILTGERYILFTYLKMIGRNNVIMKAVEYIVI